MTEWKPAPGTPVVKVVYIEHNGTRHEHELPVGWSAMDGAIQFGIKAIFARCGGACACATCHVYVDLAFVDRLPEPGKDELDALVAVATPRLPNSRLSCQIELTPDIDGLVMRLPERQL